MLIVIYLHVMFAMLLVGTVRGVSQQRRPPIAIQGRVRTLSLGSYSCTRTGSRTVHTALDEPCTRPLSYRVYETSHARGDTSHDAEKIRGRGLSKGWGPFLLVLKPKIVWNAEHASSTRLQPAHWRSLGPRPPGNHHKHILRWYSYVFDIRSPM